MNMKHFLVEGFCDGDKKHGISPCNDSLKFGIYCFECPQFSYAPSPNEIAISNQDGIVEDWIGFGGNMEPAEMEERDAYVDFWNKICKKKINQAYDEFNTAFSSKWIDIKSNEDIEEFHKQYGNFEDSYMVNFSFESGNYVNGEGIGYEVDDNILIIKFERLDCNPFSIELMFEHTRRINYLFPLIGKDNWTSGLAFAKVAKNDEFYYWTVWEEFDPYNNEHLEFNDFILIEAQALKWRVIG